MVVLDPTAYTRALTIGDDYRPYILLPSTMIEWANSVFHTTSCEIQVNGIWSVKVFSALENYC